MKKTAHVISVKLSEAEHKNLKAASRAENKTLSAYVREYLLSEAEKKAKEERKIYGELAEIILNLRTLKADIFTRMAENEARINARIEKLSHMPKPEDARTKTDLSELSNQVKKLQTENSKLRDDLAEANRNLAILKGTKR